MKNDSSKHIQKQNLLIQYLQSNQYRLIRFIKLLLRFLPADIYLLKVNNRNTSTRCEICLKLTIKTAERRHWRRSGVFIVNFKHIIQLVLVSQSNRSIFNAKSFSNFRISELRCKSHFLFKTRSY